MKTTIAIVMILAIALGLFIWKGRYTPSVTYPTQTPTVNEKVRVTTPQPNTLVKSPLSVTGEARLWYFEGSFPIKMIDANGKELGGSYVQAQGEWMTENFVPFIGTIDFGTSLTETGFLVLMKDNPSDMRELDEEIRIPVRFSDTSTQTRDIKLYFYDQQSDVDNAGNILCSAKGLKEFTHIIPRTNTPIQDAVRELLKGPSSVERLNTQGTEFPLPGLTLTGASLSGTVLTLSFSDPQNKTSGGSCRVSVLRAQIEATAKQFGGVNSVKLMPENLFQP